MMMMKRNLAGGLTVIGFLALVGSFQLFFSGKEVKPEEPKKGALAPEVSITRLSFEMPDKLVFAGEKVPLEDLDTRERFDKELLTNVYWEAQTIMIMKRAHRYFPIIEPILKKHGVPDDFKYLAVAESALTNATSGAGAKGYWQFIEAAGRKYGLEINEEVDERYNLEKATVAACKYLLESYETFGNWALAAASYNMGVGGVRQSIKYQAVNSYYDLYLNMETSRYMFRIIAFKEIMENADKYGFHIPQEQKYPPVKYKRLVVDTPIMNFVSFAKLHNINFKVLKTANPWLRKYTLSNRTRKKYEILIPEEGYVIDSSVEPKPMEDLKGADPEKTPETESPTEGQPVR